MLRFLSVILIMLGLGAAVYGGFRLVEKTYPLAETPVLAEPAPMEDDAAAFGMAEPEQVEDNFEIAGFPSDDGLTEEMPDLAMGAPVPEEGTRGLPVPALEDGAATRAAGDADALAGLRSVPIAHETPGSARFGLPFDVTVAIDGTGGDSAADALPGTGNIVEGTAQVSTQVIATLSGQSFRIEAVTPTTQAISPLTENIWRWRVTPQAVGSQQLTIELYAISEGGAAMPVRTFRDEIEVEVSRVGQVVSVVDSFSPIAVVIGGIGSFIGGLFGVLRLFRR